MKLRDIFKFSRNQKTNKSSKRHPVLDDLPVHDAVLIEKILDDEISMTSVLRLVNSAKAVRYVIDNQISGDFVECGVWRGGHSILAKKIFTDSDVERMVWMFDTFKGMTAPTTFDIEAETGIHAGIEYRDKKKKSHNSWCYASYQDVANNCLSYGLDLNGFKFVQGDVCKTLTQSENIPDRISILRLDTDWYESTKIELEMLYDRLSVGGVLIIDDYGYWKGSKKAVDEYFQNKSYKPLLNVIDQSGRSAIKLNL